jgi:hypothetical protein
MPIRPFRDIPKNLIEWSRFFQSTEIVPSNGSVTNPVISDREPLSVMGRAADFSGPPADIEATTNGLYLGRRNNLLAFQQVKNTEVSMDRTAAEIAAVVTPANSWHAEGDNRRYSSFADWIKVLSEGVEGHMWSDMTTAEMAVASGDIVIYVHGWRSVRATEAMENVLRLQGRANIFANGELLLDGDGNVTGAALHYENYFPNLTNVRALDCALGFAGGTNSYDGASYGPDGDAIWQTVTAENCIDLGWSIRGRDDVTVTAATSANPIVMTVTGHEFSTGDVLDFEEFEGDFYPLNGRRLAITVVNADTFSVAIDGSGFASYSGSATVRKSTASVTLINCKTKGTTGSGDFAGAGKFIFHVAGLKYYARYGGVFEGDSSASSTDGYKCSAVEVFGGWHHKVGRGTTVGFNSHLFRVIGTAASDIEDNAVSADTTDGAGETVGLGVLIGNVVNRAARAIRTTSSQIIVGHNLGFECTQASAHMVAAGDAREVFMDGNMVLRPSAPTNVAFGATENSQITLGVNHTDSTARQSVSGPTSGTSTVRRLVADGLSREVTADTDVRGTDRVLYLDTTAGAIDVDLPDMSEVSEYARELMLVVVAGANTVSITFQGNAANGETVNGGTTASFFASQNNRVMHLLEVSPGQWIATAGLNFIQSGSTVWNPASLGNNAAPVTTTVTVTGAIIGDFVDLSFSADLLGCVLSGSVTAADTVTAYLTNATGSTQDVANGTLRALVWRKQG